MPAFTRRPNRLYQTFNGVAVNEGNTHLADDSDVTYQASPVGGPGTAIFGQTSTPEDLLSVDGNTVDVSLRVGLQYGGGDDTFQIRPALYTSGNVNDSNLSGAALAQTVPNTGEIVVLNFTLVKQIGNTKAGWDSQRLAIIVTHSAVMSSDATPVRVYEAIVTGTYTSSGPLPINGTATSTLPAFTQAATGTYVAPKDPTNLQAVQQGADVLLTWDISSLPGATHIEIFRRSGTSTAPFNPQVEDAIARIPTGIGQYLDPNVPNGTYAYQAFSIVAAAD